MTAPNALPFSATADSINDDENPSPDLSTLLGCLDRIRAGEGADGQPWPETHLPLGRRMALARIDRAAAGLLTVAEVLHAAERCRAVATPDRHLSEGVVDGLFLACRSLAELVCQDIRPRG
ncbi:hypothetical protein [Stenotrophomonas sp. YAU14D1_LEIMI4_1]|uniref:hypothetical protein n=1 Tax=Stenotrophomonas sp. YAU14D1_LEIMI4_1 TaxID=2072407 RepID=UPI000D53F5E3|nr:hypothetical protein [Stenotrophomonas sp. YAU14D1_LEIMI4_1]AWH25144.1 hypothetical protein C1932_08545 [Stenotrophomonas sp. YAU14D1_LEIMI4_1]